MKIDSYIICATPRSGSTLLCDLLTDTGVAGRPDSFFRRETFTDWARYLEVSVAEWSSEYEFDFVYLSAVQRYGKNQTPLLGIRLMWESLDDLLKRLEAFFPNCKNDKSCFQAAFGLTKYIHLSRSDKVAQAVSYLRAKQSGLWHLHADRTERERLDSGSKPVYDADKITKLINTMEQSDAAWVEWFAQNKMDPLHLTYEALSSDPQATLATVLSALGLNPAVAKSIEPRTAKLADSESKDWIAHFRSEQNSR